MKVNTERNNYKSFKKETKNGDKTSQGIASFYNKLSKT